MARVHRADAAIDQSTVHRTVRLMCELGVVTATTVGTAETVYEIVAAVAHHHLRRTVCGKEEPLPDEALQVLRDGIRSEHGFEVRPRHLMLENVCAACGAQSGD
jgi:Fur family ferric uptake transcriptional regulator